MCGEKVKFVCKVLRTEYAQIPGYPLIKDHWLRLALPETSRPDTLDHNELMIL